MMLTVISSLATRKVLAELAATHERKARVGVKVESIGGVDAERRVEEGEAFDLVVLAAAAIDRLTSADRAHRDSVADVARSGMAAAVPAGAAHPDIATEQALRNAIVRAKRICYSTGPSGTHLVRLIERWGLSEMLTPRLLRAPPGVPVAALLARGEADLGFQQCSELLDMPGIEVVGALPAQIQEITVFRGAVCAASKQAKEARELLAYLASAETGAVKRRYGMEP
jgi:molybdate transport system substrate-binding protein